MQVLTSLPEHANAPFGSLPHYRQSQTCGQKSHSFIYFLSLMHKTASSFWPARDLKERRKQQEGKEQVTAKRKGQTSMFQQHGMLQYTVLGFFLTVFSNGNVTFGLQNGIFCWKYTVSRGLSIFFGRIQSCACMDLCTALTGGKERGRD